MRGCVVCMRRGLFTVPHAFVPPDALCYGVMTKYTGSSWKKRFFVLRGAILLYYESAASPDPKVRTPPDVAVTLTRHAPPLSRLHANATRVSVDLV